MNSRKAVRSALWCTWIGVCVALSVASGCSSSGGDTSGNGGPGSSSSSGSGDATASSGSGGSSSGSGGLFGDGSLLGDGSSGGLSDASLHNDGSPAIDGMTCASGDAGPPKFPQKCVTSTANECAGGTDSALTSLGVSSSLLNGASGNGFDDDCDGLVDEGCGCPGVGMTKPCYLVPATQVDPGTKEPVGWCTANSLGTVACTGGEFVTWSGTCRGAQPPYPDDVCAPGDFNCDGVPENSHTQVCTCDGGVGVTCPTGPLTEQPYPDPTHIPLIDGSQWIDPSERASAQNWTWTVIGGDCDNILPFPTFALYDQTDSTQANARKGARTPVQYQPTATPPRYVSTPGQPLISIQAPNYGSGVAGGQVYPAFGLSGDYIVQGEWDLNGTHYVCTQKVQVRAPGLRAELCWDSVGGSEATNPAGNDIDLHLARLQGTTCSQQGWDTNCDTEDQDCYYGNTNPTDWGYAASPGSACNGWSSHATGATSCSNPRLDLDNITCDKTISDPTQSASGQFCSPENINLDNPKDADRFIVGVNHYGNNAGTPNAHPHVDLYCNGARVLSSGFDPVSGQTSFPLLNTPGADFTGDVWSVAIVTTHVSGGQLASCDVATVPSHHADQVRDGTTNPNTAGNAICVDSTASNANPAYNYTSHAFIEHQPLQGGTNGGAPSTPAQLCKH